jgi:tetratricopeptide (TPR) repeat protein
MSEEELDQKNVDALYNKGLDLLDQYKHEEAIKYFDRVLAIEPDAVDALNNKGVALAELARYEQAVEYFDRALAIIDEVVFGNRHQASLTPEQREHYSTSYRRKGRRG